MKPAKVVPDLVRGFKIGGIQTQSWVERDTILYALGVGMSRDPMDTKELAFTYENSENFKVLPTFGATIGSIGAIFDGLVSCPGMPEFNPMMLLHGEQRLEFFKPFPQRQQVTMTSEIADVADKVKGALVTFSSDVKDESGSIICKNISKMFIRKIGGFGDRGKLQDSLPNVPQRPPCKATTDVTTPNQAILYRLAGDVNPLHIDPNMAAMGGFDRPILHGLCSFGIAGKAVLKEFCDYDVTKFKSIAARFTSHVFPGETLVTEMWKEGNKVIFAQKTQERGKIATQGYVELNEAPQPKI
mmetsp:Transcript_8289/g.8163  ORF Transcript_8289/g.8163 Transcript_8289/m.8163 type:complete len:300 (+) Transcript_8289:15-914(+)|eukprot:CAMPEP_0202948490 /NCGR_PEP_ID=MMETSP1395-20130829/13528_1 /ASSEMBLY_ACC=CAM_ASM_000871 /TAXON_ID=5961 /ORGANISM="Blepharisma japonicum, Strain Stock R1072" /LENGTH=299 /DNA_ID=CAMNT_0049650597 /DNA_START=15 /DNA_END=914 /DNA_ORIENTATION=+